MSISKCFQYEMKDGIPLDRYDATFSSVNPPLHSNSTLFCRLSSLVPSFQRWRMLEAAACRPGPSKLSNITISAPAVIASSASASVWTSTSIFRENPPTERAAWTASVIDPKSANLLDAQPFDQI